MAKDEKLFAAAVAAYKALDEKFGQDIKLLDISGISVLGDYFLITTAGNQNQMRALCDAVELALHNHGIRLLHSEGVNTGGWALLDFGSVIVHIFDKESRGYYNLERIWSDAEEIPEPRVSAD
ncbi:MAG: ribosome silencing factor [Clostridiales bacterium]|nr:ribosome silencing factor [Clostridiales bacterium]